MIFGLFALVGCLGVQVVSGLLFIFVLGSMIQVRSGLHVDQTTGPHCGRKSPRLVLAEVGAVLCGLLSSCTDPRGCFSGTKYRL